MRFSIRLGGFGKHNAEVGGKALTIRRTLLPLNLFGGEWRWRWIDGVQMSLEHDPISFRKAKHYLRADDETLCHAELDLPFGDWRSKGWVWTYGRHQLLHRQVGRRVNTWRGMFAMPRHVLKADDGMTVAAWVADCHYVFDGIIRRSADNDLARVAFGIILSMYLSEPPD